MKTIMIHKYIRELLCVLLLFCCLFLLGCANKAPEETVKSELDLIQQLDEDTIKNFISYEDMVHSTSTTGNVEKETTEAIQLFFKNFNYKIISSSATTKTATVYVEITNLDAKALAKDLCLELMRQSIDISITNTVLPSANSYFTLLRDILTTHEYELVTTRATIELVNTDGLWTIQNSDTLEDALVGGFISHLNDPYLILPEETLTLAFDMFKEKSPEDWISYLSMDDIFSTYSTNYQDVDFALSKQIAKHFAYHIKEVTVDDAKATVYVEITSLDMASVLDKYLTKLMEYAATTEAVRASDTELSDKTASLLIETLNSNDKHVTTTVEIPLINNGSTWEMQLENEFTDALLGNMNAAVETFQQKAS